MRTELVEQALVAALGAREPTADLLHHSDRGSQYASEAYRTRLATHGIAVSMSRGGDCYDNAVVESFFGTLKQELVHRSRWKDLVEARSAIAGRTPRPYFLTPRGWQGSGRGRQKTWRHPHERP